MYFLEMRITRTWTVQMGYVYENCILSFTATYRVLRNNVSRLSGHKHQSYSKFYKLQFHPEMVLHYSI